MDQDFPFNLEELLGHTATYLKLREATYELELLAKSTPDISRGEDDTTGFTEVINWILCLTLDAGFYFRKFGDNTSAASRHANVIWKGCQDYLTRRDGEHAISVMIVSGEIVPDAGWRKNFLEPAHLSRLHTAPLPTAIPVEPPEYASSTKPNPSATTPDAQMPHEAASSPRQYTAKPNPVGVQAKAPAPISTAETQPTRRRLRPKTVSFDFAATSPEVPTIAPTAPPKEKKTPMPETKPMKIFLSHKGIDKPMVQQFYDVLKELGFEPWFDKESMTAGMNLERGILKGMKESCAAVFFATPNFKDEKYIGAEVDHAITQKRERGDDFIIITLVFHGKDKKGEVPELFRPYIWDAPPSGLEGLRTILKSIPVKVGPVVWGRK